MEYLSSVSEALKEVKRKYNFSSFNLKTLLQLKKATGTRRMHPTRNQSSYPLPQQYFNMKHCTELTR